MSFFFLLLLLLTVTRDERDHRTIRNWLTCVCSLPAAGYLCLYAVGYMPTPHVLWQQVRSWGAVSPWALAILSLQSCLCWTADLWAAQKPLGVTHRGVDLSLCTTFFSSAKSRTTYRAAPPSSPTAHASQTSLMLRLFAAGLLGAEVNHLMLKQLQSLTWFHLAACLWLYSQSHTFDAATYAEAVRNGKL